MPTTSRAGKSSASVSSAMRSLGIVEDRHQHHAVGDVEVGITGGKAAAFKDDRAGHGEFDNLEGLAIVVAGRSQASQVVLAARSSCVLRDPLRSWRRPCPEPRSARCRPRGRGCRRRRCPRPARSRTDAEIVGKHLFVCYAVHGGIALLLGREQALFGGEQGAATVHVDGAAFEHDPMICQRRAAARAPAARAMRLPTFSSNL